MSQPFAITGMQFPSRLRLVLIAAIITLLPLSAMTGTDSPAPDARATHFDQLQEQLIQDGFDRMFIRSLYQRPPVKLELVGVSLYAKHREATLNYDQYLSRKMIRKAKRYLENYESELIRAEKDYGVEKEIIIAVMLVETRLGTYTGGRSVFNTLSSMSVLAEPAVRTLIYEEMVKGSRSKLDFDAWADRKSKWAYNELKALLTYTNKYGIDPLTLNGSYAGAVGIPQFMPSNILPYGRDGNGDGRIDLFNHGDAIASIASYLKQFGWKPGIDRETKIKVLLRYNYSKYYVETLLKIVERLKAYPHE
ncbi:MAG: lytic murein transglycosylase [Thermodesulfobacteriota bacterium]